MDCATLIFNMYIGYKKREAVFPLFFVHFHLFGLIQSGDQGCILIVNLCI